VALIYRRDDLLIVAADGLVNGKFAFCKVRPEGEWVFTATGVYGIVPNDVFTIARTTIRSRSVVESIEHTVQEIGDRAKPFIEADILHLLDTNRKEFNRQISHEAAISFALSHFSQGIPVVCYWEFKANWDGRRSVTLTPKSAVPSTCPGNGCISETNAGTPTLLEMGTYDAIAAFAVQNRGFIAALSKPGDIKRLIQIDIEADKEHLVGHPIDVLVIDRNGPHWYDPEAESKCPPIARRKRLGK
jgi:hypothetical protein